MHTNILGYKLCLENVQTQSSPGNVPVLLLRKCLGLQYKSTWRFPFCKFPFKKLSPNLSPIKVMLLLVKMVDFALSEHVTVAYIWSTVCQKYRFMTG